MRRLRQLSLRTKMIGAFIVPTLLLVFGYGGTAYMYARKTLEAELGTRLVSIGETLSAQWSDGFDAMQLERLNEDKERVRQRFRQRLQTVKKRTGVKRLYLFDRDYRNLVDTDPSKPFGETIYKLQADRQEINTTFEDNVATTSVLFEGSDGQLYKKAFVPITLEDRVIAALAVEASAAYFGSLRRFATVLVVVGAVGLALIVLVGAGFSAAITRPIGRLVEAAQRLGEGDLDKPVTETPEPTEQRHHKDTDQLQDGSAEAEADDETGDEIAFLATAFEEMRRDILNRDQQMKMMLSGIAHEVRNPLGGVELFCGLITQDLEADEDLEEAQRDELLEKVGRIEREVDYLERVVDDFRDFATEVSLEWDRFSAEAFAREIDDVIGGECRDSGCALEFDIEEGMELTADRSRLKQIVLNLARNAYQACDEKSTNCVTLDITAPSDDRRRVTVRDDGPGMTQEAIDQMMTPFFTTKQKGSGLGLPLSQELAEQHGGRITVDSELGEGTAVTVELPFRREISTTSKDVPEGWLG
jgi:signal transduction histidine kinase